MLLLAERSDPTEIPVLAAAGWSTTVLAVALRWADDGSLLPDAWRRWCDAHVDDPVDLDLLAAASSTQAALVRSTLRRSSPLRSVPYVAGLLVPSRAHLRSRGLRRRDQVSGLVRSVTGRGSR